jgi:hypothetical protein
MVPAKLDVANLVQDLESRLLPGLQRVAQEITQQFPRVKAMVWSASVGSRTDYQGHDLGIDCLLTDARQDQTDNLALVIGIAHVTTVPSIEASVCWGAPSGRTEAELFPASTEVTPEIVHELEERLPLLYEALREAVGRGHPPDEA